MTYKNTSSIERRSASIRMFWRFTRIAFPHAGEISCASSAGQSIISVLWRRMVSVADKTKEKKYGSFKINNLIHWKNLTVCFKIKSQQLYFWRRSKWLTNQNATWPTKEWRDERHWFNMTTGNFTSLPALVWGRRNPGDERWTRSHNGQGRKTQHQKTKGHTP